MSDVEGALKSKQLKTEVDEYLKVKIIFLVIILCINLDCYRLLFMGWYACCSHFGITEAGRLFLSKWPEAKIASASEWSNYCWDTLQCASDQFTCSLCWHPSEFPPVSFLIRKNTHCAKYALKSQMIKVMLLHHLKHPLNYYFHHVTIIGTHDVLLWCATPHFSKYEVTTPWVPAEASLPPASIFECLAN